MERASAAGPDEFDLVVVGSGPAGEKGANQAAYFGYRVAVVERRSQPGGAAIAVSGVPVKALRDTAVYLTGWSRRDVYGVGISLAPDLVMDFEFRGGKRGPQPHPPLNPRCYERPDDAADPAAREDDPQLEGRRVHLLR